MHPSLTIVYTDFFPLLQKQQQAKIEEMTEREDKNLTRIALLTAEVGKLTQNAKESQDNIGWYQVYLGYKNITHFLPTE